MLFLYWMISTFRETLDWSNFILKKDRCCCVSLEFLLCFPLYQLSSTHSHTIGQDSYCPDLCCHPTRRLTAIGFLVHPPMLLDGFNSPFCFFHTWPSWKTLLGFCLAERDSKDLALICLTYGHADFTLQVISLLEWKIWFQKSQ